MPDSEERSIERLLRSAAAKRCDQVGSPEMHPATRETLLTEVRRQYGPGSQATSKPWWRRLAPALAVVAVLATGTWLIVRDESMSPMTMELVKVEPPDFRQNGLEKRSASELSAEVSLNVPQQEGDKLAPAPDEATFASTEQPVRQPTDPVARNGTLGDVPSRTDLALAAASKADVETFAEGTSSPASGTTAVPVMEPAPPPAAASAREVAVLSAPVRSEPSDGELRRLKAATSADSIGNVSQNINEVAVPVLQNFVVVTRNERVRFIDEDGSVYEGRIESAPADVETKASDSQGRPPGAQTEVLAAAPMEQSKTEVQTVSYTFDAAGINQSLRRSVRFTGQMVLTGQQALQDRNAFANTLLPAQQRVQAGQQALPSVGVDGTLRLDDGTTLRVQAVPAAP